MIPFASQRGLGQDLATHLMNEEDNEYMEVAQVHGAFAEWEAQAHGLTKCRNYLYSLSVNPDQFQRRLTREEYLGYIEAVEKKLGLDGQPRAVVFHIKNEREHCHVVWSRTIAAERKAVHMPFDHDKLMMVTREFAEEKGLRLPDGYYKDTGRKKGQPTLYHQHQQNVTGLTQEERKALVTQAWKQSDSAKAFVNALEDQGYMLARGERPYVLVDLYGQMSSLPRLIDDPGVRLKDVRAFLEKEFPPESLPSVEEAKELAAEYRQMSQDFAKADAKAKELERLKERQALRRKKTEQEIKQAKDRQSQERRELYEHHRKERLAFGARYLAEVRRIRQEREAKQTRRLPKFLGKITGVSFIRNKVQQYRDRKLYDTFIEGKTGLLEKQQAELRALQHRQHLQDLDLDRKSRALDRVEAHERRSLDKNSLRGQRTRQRGSHEHMPAFRLDLKPPGRPAAPHKVKNRFTSPHRQHKSLPKAEITDKPKTPDVREDFDRAAGDGRSGNGSGNAAGAFKPVAEEKTQRREPEASGRAEEFNRVAKATDSASRDFNKAAEAQRMEDAGSDDATAPKPVTEAKTSRKRRRSRKRERDRGKGEVQWEATETSETDHRKSRTLERKWPDGQEKRRLTRQVRKRKRDKGREL